ncbi:hypothetical protein BSKO_13304 [Bryopsis sp. KO-2023]|nr:hypothetical protein BSKO_13304 [Bryopsis sp. KO-2023]
MPTELEYEVTPLVPVKEEEEEVVVDQKQNALSRLGDWTYARNFILIVLWYFFSTSLSLFNKKLLGKEHGIFGDEGFPAPLLMTSVQFFCQYLLSRMVLDVGMVKRESNKSEKRTWKEYMRNVLPNGISTGLDIGFSNMSLQTISLSFYVMCKSTTPMFLLLFAFIWKIEKPSWSLAGVVLTICCGVLLLVHGESKFDLLGFFLVMSAACLSGLRWTLTQVLLQGKQKGESQSGPLEVLQQLMPVMSVTVLIVSIFMEKLVALPNSAYFQTWEHGMISFLLLFFSAVLAFMMVWTEFKVIKETSALTFMIAGTLKEVVTVLAAVMLFGEDFGPVNAIGLAILIGGVSLYNFYKYKKANLPNEGRPQQGDLALPLVEIQPNEVSSGNPPQVKQGAVKIAPRRQRKGQGLHRDAPKYSELAEIESDREKLQETITSTHHRTKPTNGEIVNNGEIQQTDEALGNAENGQDGLR